MENLIPDLLRSLVSTVMSAVLLIVLGQPRLKKSLWFIVAGVFVLDMLTAVLFYLYGDLNMLARADILLYVGLGIILKPFFKDTMMQWVFNCITSLNVFAAVLFLSFWISRFLPSPVYSNTVLRLLLFSAVILIFRRLRPLYRQVSKRWPLFVLTVAAILLNYLYYIIGSGDVVKTLTEQWAALLLLTVLAAAVYIIMFYSLEKILQEYALREENLQMQNRQDILNLSVSSMRQRLHMMNETAEQTNIAAHDRRHFNHTILELLRQDKVANAMNILERQNALVQPTVRHFCENTTVDAAIAYYANLAENSGIEFETDLDIPETLNVDSLELAIVVSNLLENAINACEKLLEDTNKTIHFTAAYTGQLLLQIQNPYTGEVKTDEHGHPVSDKSDHGTGTKSVLAFAEKQNAQVIYTIGNGVFRVRIII